METLEEHEDQACKAGICSRRLSSLARGADKARDLDVVIVVGKSSSSNMRPRDDASPELKWLAKQRKTVGDLAEFIVREDVPVAPVCEWSAELNTLFHMFQVFGQHRSLDLNRVARVTLLSTTNREKPGSQDNAAAIEVVLGGVLPQDTIHHERLLFEQQDGGVDGLHGHQHAFARRLKAALTTARAHHRQLVVVASGGLKIQSMMCGAFAYATGTRTVYMHEDFKHRVVEFGELHGLFGSGADTPGDPTGLLRAGTMPWADVPRIPPGVDALSTGRPFEDRLRHEVLRRGWADGDVLVNKDLSMPRQATPCEVSDEESDEGPVLVARIFPFTLRVRPQQAAWRADPHGLRDELAGLILSELGK